MTFRQSHATITRMAEILSEGLSAWKSHRGRKYPWDEWLDGQPRRLVGGEDFTIDPLYMTQAIHATGRRRRITVRTRRDGDDVLIQACGRLAAD